jgi:hypothetical protein
MGYDITMYAEFWRDGRWFLAEPLERNPAFHPEHPLEEPEWKPTEVIRERNYALFAVLADVCNPTCSTEPFESIAPPRGLPSDVSEPLRIWHAQNDGDTWSESWLLLKEILEFAAAPQIGFNSESFRREPSHLKFTKILRLKDFFDIPPRHNDRKLSTALIDRLS